MSHNKFPAAGMHLPTGISDRGLRYLILAATGTFILLCGLVTLAIFGTQIPAAALIVSVIAAVIPVPIFAALILWLDRYEKEPGFLIVSAFLWGAAVASLFALFLNTGVGAILASILGPQWANVVTPTLVAPIVEETAKGIALVLLFLLARQEFDDIVDGIVYGGLIGLGFAMTENVLYFARAHKEGGLMGVGVLFYIRVILSGFNHSLFTGATGAGLGYARETNNGFLKVVGPFLGYLCGIFLHFLWNGTASLLGATALAKAGPLVELFVILPGMSFLLALPGIATLVILSTACWRREVKIIQEHLADEVSRGTVLQSELAVLGDWRERWRRSRAALSKGPRAWYGLRQLYELEVDLAFRKWHASRGERLLAFQQVLTEDGLRERIGQVRSRLSAMGISTT